MALTNENAQILKGFWREGHWETQEKTGSIFIFLGAAFLNDFILFTQYFFKGATLFQSDMMEMEKILRIPS